MFGFAGTREWVYPQSVKGRYQRVRVWTFVGLHLVFFLAPWITMGGSPLLLINVPARQVLLFGQIFTASDTIFLLLLLLFLAFSLFLFTSLWGRLWCGYACPQTVFLESWIRPLELWIEGDRTTRKRRDQMGFTFDKVWRKGVKWIAFLAVSLFLAMAIMSLFSGARELWTLNAGPISYAFVAFFTGAWFIDFVWFREQFCNYLCPYARFQGALTDDETLIIQYEPDRGEPRGGKTAAADGRCIDCKKCVVVCPQGIDIRNGFQLECIQCARCIDACVGVMDRLGHPTLVKYGSIAEAEGRTVRRLKPRTVVYAALLSGILAGAMGFAMNRVHFEASVNRAPGSLYTLDADGYVRNTFLLKITDNQAGSGVTPYQVTVDGLDQAEILVQGVELGTGESRTVPLIVRVSLALELDRTTPIRVHVSTPDGELVLETTFKSGADLAPGDY